ncbi:MAG TPA: DNA polymerase I, partial [Candidatus Dormibacteraeota bacterium]|nr:DNA polymerase I [Candidatus Dormibacteraeota bacterium]
AAGFEYGVAAFDPPGPTFREERYPAYKAQRQHPPEEFSVQVPTCRRLAERLGLPVVAVPGYEADDVIGTLTEQAEAAGWDTVILTSDLDALQLVTDHTVVQASRRGLSDTVIYDPAAVRERFGFDPPRIIDFKALRGDASDNLPGVPGIGEKTATSLLQQHGDLEGVLGAVPSMAPGRVRSALEAHADVARLGHELVTIIRDVPGVSLAEVATPLAGYDRAAAATALREIGMPSLIARLPAGAGSPAATAAGPEPTAAEVTVEIVRDDAGLIAAVAAARVAGQVAIRTVADEPARRGHLVGLAMAVDPTHAFYFVLDPGEAPLLDRIAMDPLLDLLQDPAVALTGYHLKGDLLAWRAHGIRLRGIAFDCVLASYLADSRVRTSTLQDLARQQAGLELTPEAGAGGRSAAATQPSALAVPAAADRFGREAAAVTALQPALTAALRAQGALELLVELELPLLPVLADLEATGIRVEVDRLAELGAELGSQIDELEAAIYAAAGRTFTIGSPQQLAQVLYDEMGFASGRRTKTGRSTDARALEALRGEHPIVDKLLTWRQLTKLKSTYVDSLPQLVDAEDGRVHTSFNQAVAATGRLSSSDPNLQNIPIRTEVGRRIRAAFVPGKRGWRLVSADYSQVELRVLAHLSEDPGLLAAFAAGTDIHQRTAAEVFGVPEAAVTRDQRRMAKIVNFGILYGLSTFGLSRDLNIPAEAAGAFIERYFATFPGVRAYLEGVRAAARADGYVSTVLGRRRHLPEINAHNRQLREASERMAINHPVQGSAADIMKRGMLRAADALSSGGLRARMLLQVHDELVFEAPAREVAAVGEVARRAMEGAARLRVPLVVDLKAGVNWRDLEPLEITPAHA